MRWTMQCGLATTINSTSLGPQRIQPPPRSNGVLDTEHFVLLRKNYDMKPINYALD